MPPLFLCLIVVFCLQLPPQNAFAAFKSASDAIPAANACNPHEDADDIILPMPCKLSLVLRAVDIPSGSIIGDRTFAMGINNSSNQDRQIYDRRFAGHIAAPFTASDLPASWRDKLPKSISPEDTWYFMGKYEVSQAQWDAVMNALNAAGVENASLCPKPGAPAGDLPARGVSWFEVQDFLNRYNAWLVRNHAQSLPAFHGTRNIAFLRLPTEEEWEYAARGGSRVPPEWWAEKDIFPIPEDKSLADYGVYRSGAVLEAPLAIGSRNANPLGLYDTAGNVREMVDGFFRMSIAEMRNGQMDRRLHGAAGGILAKGGGFRGEAESVMPGCRDEVPLYTANGPASASDLGLRLVLGGLNIPSAQRLEQLRKEDRTAVKRPDEAKPEAAVEPHKNQSPLEALDAMAENAEGVIKDRLFRLRALLADQESAATRLNARNMEQTFRSLLYQSETLRAFALRYQVASQEVEKLKKLLEQPMDASTKARATKVLKEARSDLADYLQSLQMGVNYYKTGLASLYGQGGYDLSRLFAQARREYGGEGVFNEHMRQNLEELGKNLGRVEKGGISSLSRNSILKGILPRKHYEALPEAMKN